MPGLDPVELDIRRWWYLHRRNYEDGSSAWLTCPNWPLWRQIGYLLETIDRLHMQQRMMELAADENKDTEHLSAIFRPRPPSSDDTIAITWAPSPPSDALTPVKAVPSVHDQAHGPLLPPYPPPVAPPKAPLSALTPLEHNKLIMKCESAVETTMRGCISHGVNPYDTLARLLTAIKALRVAIPMDMPLDDEGHTR